MTKLLRFAAAGMLLTLAPMFAQHSRRISAPVPVKLGSSIYKGPKVKVAPPVGIKNTVAVGKIQLGIKLSDPPLVAVVGTNAKQHGSSMTAAQQRAYLAQLKQKQDAVMAQVVSLGGVELGRVSKAHNALVVSIDAKQLPALRALGGVAAVRIVQDSQIALANTLPYIGATAVQNSGVTGQGIRVAMLDTGIDYTHYNLGGSGNIADYQAAMAVAAGTPPANLFPTAKVIGGYDFTGEVWPNGPLAPDPNPLDLNGHGSHTSDIVGGHSLDGLHVGTAPGSLLYAVKVCSSVASACSGLAILEGLDFAVDPGSTGTVNSPVDVISMSIGGPFGQREDDGSEALTAIVSFGVTAVLAGGNNGDIPYILGSPGSTPTVLTMGATTSVIGSVIPLLINSPASIQGTYSNTQTLSFAPINSAVTANVVYVGRGCPASGGTPADPYLNNNVAGRIVLIDRGACAVSLKIDRAGNAGAVGVLIGLVAPGDAITFSSGGGTNFPASLVITQATSNSIKSALAGGAVSATIDPNKAISTAGNIASYSSRGPNYSYNMLKPDMSAPGTIVAADPGTGNGQSSESGTSFATPLAAGSAALLLSKNHMLTPTEVKALLMESAETNVFQNTATQPGALAPLSRAGSGELRVNRAVAATTALWDASDPGAVSLSFGTYRLNVSQTFKKKVVIRNYSNSARTYSLSSTYRDAPNQTGVILTFPSSVSVPANGSTNFVLTATVNATALPVWTLDGGPDGGNGELLNTVEYAGYLNASVGDASVHLPWHILPHKAANVTPSTSTLALNGGVTGLGVSNTPAAADGGVSVFSLTGIGTQFPPADLPPPGSEFAVVNLRAVGLREVCLAVDNSGNCTAFGAQFAINTFGQRSHPDVPAEFDVRIDVNNDGTDDLVVFNEDIGLATTGSFSGQNGVFVADIAAGTAIGPFFYTIADLDSSNVIFTVPLSALSTAGGLNLVTNAPFTYAVLAFDNYFTGNLTDFIAGMTYELDFPQEFPLTPDVVVPANASDSITVISNGNPISTSQTGLLLMYQDGKAGQEASLVTVTP